MLRSVGRPRIEPGSNDLISRELAPNERLFWSGGPKTGIRLRPADAVMIPFSR